MPALSRGTRIQARLKPIVENVAASGIFVRQHDVQPANELSVSAQVGGNWMPIRISGDEFDKQILLAYFGAQQRRKMLAPETQPQVLGEKPRACRAWDRVDAQEILGIISENPRTDLTAPLNTLD